MSSMSFRFQYPTLTRGNYMAWAMRTKVIMRAEGLWEAIEPAAGRSGTVDERTEAMALAAIYQGIPDDAVLSLVGTATARQAWEALERMYLGDARAREAKVKTLKTELDVLQMEKSESICDLAWKVRRILGTIRLLGGEVDEAGVVTNILMAVPSRFAGTVAAIDKAGKMTVEEAIGRLQVHEEIIRRRGYLLIHGRCIMSKCIAAADTGIAGAQQQRKVQGSVPQLRCHNCGCAGHYESQVLDQEARRLPVRLISPRPAHDDSIPDWIQNAEESRFRKYTSFYLLYAYSAVSTEYIVLMSRNAKSSFLHSIAT